MAKKRTPQNRIPARHVAVHAVCAAILLIGSVTHAQEQGGVVQIVTPNVYRALPVAERRLYVAGAFDALIGFSLPANAMLKHCLTGTSVTQLTQIVDERLPRLTSVERSSTPVAVHNALLQACLDRGYKE
jgi:hypothetical protein